jgi:hypothetical protein
MASSSSMPHEYSSSAPGAASSTFSMKVSFKYNTYVPDLQNPNIIRQDKILCDEAGNELCVVSHRIVDITYHRAWEKNPNLPPIMEALLASSTQMTAPISQVPSDFTRVSTPGGLTITEHSGFGTASSSSSTGPSNVTSIAPQLYESPAPGQLLLPSMMGLAPVVPMPISNTALYSASVQQKHSPAAYNYLPDQQALVNPENNTSSSMIGEGIMHGASSSSSEGVPNGQNSIESYEDRNASPSVLYSTYKSITKKKGKYDPTAYLLNQNRKKYGINNSINWNLWSSDVLKNEEQAMNHLASLLRCPISKKAGNAQVFNITFSSIENRSLLALLQCFYGNFQLSAQGECECSCSLL